MLLTEVINNIKYSKIKNINDLLNSYCPVWKNIGLYPKGFNNTTSYDVKDSWFNALKYLGYKQLAKKVKNMPKNKRVPFIMSFNKKDNNGNTLYDNIEQFWVNCIKEFIIKNNIKFEQIISIFYDEIELISDTKVNNTIINIDNNITIKFIKK